MKKLLVFAVISLLGVGQAMAGNCYEIIGCDDEDRFQRSDLRQFSCQALWELRNTIYYEHGYCFQTDRAIDFFGEDCDVEDAADLGFNRIEQSNIDTIKAVERQKRCGN